MQVNVFLLIITKQQTPYNKILIIKPKDKNFINHKIYSNIHNLLLGIFHDL